MIGNLKIKGEFERLESERRPYLDNARRMASFTLPGALPEDPKDLATPHQSLGALGVNNLVSKLLLSLLPPNQLFFKLDLNAKAKLQLQQIGDPKVLAEVRDNLQQLEGAVVQDIDQLSLRTALHSHLRNLVLTGSSVLFLPTAGTRPAYSYRLDEFVFILDRAGDTVECILQETIDWRDIPQELFDKIHMRADGTIMERDEDRPSLYTQILREPWDPIGGKEPKYKVTREIMGWEYGETKVYKKSELPWIMNILPANPGESYGHGFVSDFFGDLLTLDGLTQSVTEAASLSAWALVMVRLTAGVDPDTITKAPNGSAVMGNPDDVGVLQFGKGADLSPAIGTIDTLRRALGAGFLMHSAQIRDAERVTTEELRVIAQELEETQGGAYSYLARWLQMPMAQLLMRRIETVGLVDSLPEDIKPTILTGFDALGRARDARNLQEWVGTALTLFPEEAPLFFRVGEIIKVMANQRQIVAKEWLKTDEEVAEIQQQRQMQAMIEKLGPSAITGMSKPENVASIQAAREQTQ